LFQFGVFKTKDTTTKRGPVSKWESEIKKRNNRKTNIQYKQQRKEIRAVNNCALDIRVFLLFFFFYFKQEIHLSKLSISFNKLLTSNRMKRTQQSKYETEKIT